MKHVCMLISVADINAARKFYEDLFGLEVFQACRSAKRKGIKKIQQCGNSL